METAVDDDRVTMLLKENPNLLLNDNGKVKCTLTGHEMAAKQSAILQYLNGKKYRRIMSKDKFNFSDFEPLIVPSTKKGHEKHLFCTLTLRHINKTPPHVLRHVSGKRYQKAKARWEECQKTGTKFVPTPLLSKSSKYKDDGGAQETETDMMSDDNSSEGNDDLSDLYPVKYFEELSLHENASNDVTASSSTVKKKASRKRSKPGTKPMKCSKPAAKRKKAGLIVST